MVKVVCLALFLFCSFAENIPAFSEENVFEKGSFEILNSEGDMADGWWISDRKKITLVVGDVEDARGARQGKHGGNHWIRITNDNPETSVTLNTRLKLKSDWVALKVTARMQTRNIKVGKKHWHVARLTLRFENNNNKMVGSWPEQLLPLSIDSDWTDVSTKIIDIPDGATQLSLTPALYHTTGIMEIDDIRVKALNKNSIYFNGVKVGTVGKETPSFWTFQRKYKIPASLVKPGENVIAVRVFDHFQAGGFRAEPYEMKLSLIGGPLNVKFYYLDFRRDRAQGDDPYRYWRW